MSQHTPAITQIRYQLEAESAMAGGTLGRFLHRKLGSTVRHAHLQAILSERHFHGRDITLAVQHSVRDDLAQYELGDREFLRVEMLRQLRTQLRSGVTWSQRRARSVE